MDPESLPNTDLQEGSLGKFHNCHSTVCKKFSCCGPGQDVNINEKITKISKML